MNCKTKLLLLLLCGAISVGAEIAPYIPAPHRFTRAEVIRPETPLVRSLNGEWKFSGVTNSTTPFPDDVDQSFALPGFDDSQWGTIPVPLNWYQKFPKARRGDEPYVKGFYREMNASGIPFEIINPAENNGKSCLVLSGTERKYFPDAIKQIKVNRKLSRLFFLHTAAWGDQPEAGRYRIHYSDGKAIDFVLNGKRNIGDWWNPVPLPEAKEGVALRNLQGVFVGTYVAEWNNPRPETEISAIDFLSPLYRDKADVDWIVTQTAVPILIALSGELAHPSPIEITRTAYRGVSGAKEGGSVTTGKISEHRDGNDGKRWDIHFPAVSSGNDIPAAFFIFGKDGNSGDYRYLTLEVKSSTGGIVQLVLPDANWKHRYSGDFILIGDNRYHTYRLRIGKELKGSYPLKEMRGELFFFHRSSQAFTPSRPEAKFSVKRAVLE